MNVFIDIETVPDQSPTARERIARNIRPPATYKKAETIAAWEANEKPAAVEEAYLKTSFDGTYGQVVCVSWATDAGDTSALHVPDLSAESEAAMLEVFWHDIRALHAGNSGTRPVIVGHNHVAFDLPFLWKRSVIRGQRPPLWWPKAPKAWSDVVYDTMTQWAGDRERISMDALCAALGIPGKAGGPTGADVWPMSQAGQFAEICDYCRADVERTRSIFRRMNFITTL